MKIRSYSELSALSSFEERYDYLRLKGFVGEETFGSDRYINQAFYTSPDWRHVRRQVIIRDNGCDLAIDGLEIHKGLYIHHMNPLTKEQILGRDPSILDPEFLITVTHQTHNAIHYGQETLLPPRVTERRPGDTKMW